MIGAINKIDSLKISKKLTRFDSELMTPQISLKAIELIDKYSLSHGLSISDSLIAATALVVKLPLFTYNVKDYKFISELELFNPKA